MLPAGQLIFVPKVYPTRLKERRYPTRQELDEAAPKNPAISDNGYAAALNSMALAQAGITALRPKSDYGVSLILGTAELTMKELASLYGILANGGIQRPLRETLDASTEGARRAERGFARSIYEHFPIE